MGGTGVGVGNKNVLVILGLSTTKPMVVKLHECVISPPFAATTVSCKTFVSVYQEECF